MILLFDILDYMKAYVLLKYSMDDVTSVESISLDRKKLEEFVLSEELKLNNQMHLYEKGCDIEYKLIRKVQEKIAISNDNKEYKDEFSRILDIEYKSLSEEDRIAVNTKAPDFDLYSIIDREII